MSLWPRSLKALLYVPSTCLTSVFEGQGRISNIKRRVKWEFSRADVVLIYASAHALTMFSFPSIARAVASAEHAERRLVGLRWSWLSLLSAPKPVMRHVIW